MKKMLFVLFSAIAIGSYVLLASANHYGIPTVGQEREETVWSCITKDDAKIFVTSRAEVESYFSSKETAYFAWIKLLREMNRLNRCEMEMTEYVIEEIVETVSGLEVLSREFGEPMLHYIIKTKDGHFVVTY